jgi:hypothetical protein
MKAIAKGIRKKNNNIEKNASKIPSFFKLIELVFNLIAK